MTITVGLFVFLVLAIWIGVTLGIITAEVIVNALAAWEDKRELAKNENPSTRT